MNRTTLVIAALAVIAALVAFGVAVGGRSATPAPGLALPEAGGAARAVPVGAVEVRDVASMPHQDSQTDTRPASGAASASFVPMPPLDAPLVEVFDELESLAAAGDAAAACRLSAELSACTHARILSRRAKRREERMEQFARHAANRNMDEDEERAYIARVAAQMDREDRLTERCHGVTGDMLGSRPYYHLQAARAGHQRAAARFVGGDGLTPASLVADVGLSEAYRENAWPLFQELLEAGDPAAAAIWSFSLTLFGPMHHAPLAAVMPEEWRRPDVALALAQRVGRETGMELHNGSAPAPSDEAKAEADRLFERYYAGVSPLSDLFAYGDPESLEQEREHCLQLSDGPTEAR